MATKQAKFFMNGISEIDKNLDRLADPKLRKRVLRNSAKGAFRRVYEDAKQNCPVGDGEDGTKLKDSIRMSTSIRVVPKTTKSGKLTKSSKNELAVRVIAGNSKELSYAARVEFGRESFTIRRITAFNRQTRSYTVRVGEIAPRPFMRMALYNNLNQVTRDFKTNLSKEWEKAAKLEIKRQKRKNK